jgi:class 3 adenylate cyclase
MFCDLVGSTRLSAELDAEDLRELLRGYHEICATEIEGRGGMIASYLGDGVMAYFGYPQAREDAAVKAADAGLGIASRVAQMGDRLASERGISLAARVALHTGRVLVGEMGAGETRDRHAVTGVVPNLAARLESLAPRNGVVVSGQTRALIERAFRVDAMGSYELKGIPLPVEVYRVLGRKPAASVLRDRRRRLIGREAELDLLTAAWEKVLRGEAAQVTVVAEPGVGKSALAACFIERVPIEPRRVIEFAGSLGERNAPFACLRQTIARHLQAAGALTAEDGRQALAGWLGTTDETAAPHVETMLALWRGDLAAGSEGRAAVFAAAAALFAAVQPPVLVVLEDAHWIDPSTLELLDRILGAAGTGRLALVLTRPDARLDWQRADDATIRLRQLDPAGCRRLIEAVAGCPVGASLAQRIEAATDGLPLYVEEFTKALLESGQVRRQRGVLRSAELDAAIETPASLLDLITSRLDRLGDAKIFAQIAAVLGRRFDRAALVAVSGRATDEVDAVLRTLEARESSPPAPMVTSPSATRSSRRRPTRASPAIQAHLAPPLSRVAGRGTGARPCHATGDHRLSSRRLRRTPRGGRPLCRGRPRGQPGIGQLRGRRPLRPRPRARRPGRRRRPRHHGPAARPGAPGRCPALGPGARCARDPCCLRRGAAARRGDAGVRMASRGLLGLVAGLRELLRDGGAGAPPARRLQRMRGAEFRLQALHCGWANAFQMGELEAARGRAKVGLELYEEAGREQQQTLYGGHDCKVCALGETALATGCSAPAMPRRGMSRRRWPTPAPSAMSAACSTPSTSPSCWTTTAATATRWPAMPSSCSTWRSATTSRSTGPRPTSSSAGGRSTPAGWSMAWSASARAFR